MMHGNVMARSGRVSRSIRVYVDGIDMEPAYADQLIMQAKSLFSNVFLMVGVSVVDGQLYEMLRQCRYVDQIIRPAPYVVDDVFLVAHQIDLIARCQCDVYGLLLVLVSRWRPSPAPDFIATVVKDYDVYVRRNRRSRRRWQRSVECPLSWRFKLGRLTGTLGERVRDLRTLFTFRRPRLPLCPRSNVQPLCYYSSDDTGTGDF